MHQLVEVDDLGLSSLRKRRRFLLGGSASLTFIMALSWAGVGQAQTASTASAGGPAAVGPAGSADIIVTAQKHKERLQDVPFAISAKTSEQLTTINATKLLDIATVVPGLSIVSQTGTPGSNTIDIRGISTADEASTTVATLVDDVPVNSSSANAYSGLAGLDLMPYLIDNVEVLKGPQGTLYGASSLGGLLKYVTPTPSLTQTSFSVGAGVSTVAHGDEPGYSFRASGSAPLVDDALGVDFRLEHSFSPGYIDDNATHQKDFNSGEEDGGELGILWKPSSNFSLKATAILQASDYAGVSSILLNSTNTAPADNYYAADYPLYNGNRSIQDTQVYSINANYDFGWGTFTSVTGYSDLHSSFKLDISEASYDIYFGINADDKYTLITDKWTQEFRLASPVGSRFHWTAGFFYTNEASQYYEGAIPYDKVTGGVATSFMPFYFSAIDSTYDEYAGFATVGYNITPNWDVNVGGRYATNDQTGHGFGNGFLNGGPYDTGTLKTSDSAFTYSVDTRYHFTPDVMLYGRIATGYRPGGDNLTVGIPATFKPDTTTNYEVGIKSEWFDRRLLLDADVFYIDWNAIHVLERLANLLDTYTGNGGTATSEGVELETHYQITPEFQIGLNGAYVDATFQTPDPAIGTVKGSPLPNTPHWTGSIFANWNHPLMNDWVVSAGGSLLYVGDRVSDFPAANPPGIVLKAYDTLNLNAGVANAKWKVNVFMTNALNEKALVTRRNFGAVILEPQVIGVNVDRSF